jgi:putative hydrolase of HD superfamily
MINLLDFFNEVGKLKGMPRRGWVIREIKNPESIAEHTFRVALMAWLFAATKKEKEKMNLEKLIKMALIHDLCEVYAGDTTPYDSILPKDKKEIRKLMKTWPRFSKEKREKLAKEKFDKEKKALCKIIENLPPSLKKEIKNLWLDYEKGLSPEGRFFRQTDRIESFLQATEYWSKYKKPDQKPIWLWARELFDDPILLEFVDAMNKKFYNGKLLN